MAKFALVTERWMEENGLVATAVQCWTAMEEYFGVVPCAVMSMMSNALKPSACEADITGAIACMPWPWPLQAQCLGGLEQQLRRRSRQGRHLSLQQPSR